MQRLSKIYWFFFLVAVSTVAGTGCSKKLDEQPRAVLTPQYFQTAAGLNAAVISAYSGLRFIYGPEGALCLSVIGTDEFTIGGGAGTGEIDFDGYGSQLNSGEGNLLGPWNNNFTYINACNGVIQIGPTAAGLTPAQLTTLVGEAKFLRAFYYYNLVIQFGGVPLDLGSGRLKFNVAATSASTRDSLSTCYAAIIQDLTDAAAALPNTTSTPGRATKAAALFFLAKAYLTRGWSSVGQPTDFTNAYTTASSLISTAGTYGLGLLPDYGQVNKQGNEHSSESIFTVEHTGNYTTNESAAAASVSSTTAAMGNKMNVSCFLFVPYYQIQTLYNGATPVTRDGYYQRPYRRFKPTRWLTDTCFADKFNDSRYNNSFRTVWLCNVAGSKGPLGNMNVGDTAFYLPGFEPTPAQRNAHNYAMWGPSQYGGPGATPITGFPSTVNTPSESLYPHMRKFDDTARAALNDPSTRTQIVSKLSELYLIAAEAALKSNDVTNATRLVNVLRVRAAYQPGLPTDTVTNRANALKVASVDLDFILDERARELCGEQLRWFDLVRTGTLLSRAIAHNNNAAPNIKSFHNLRPIPQTQINLVQGSVFPQNPGY